VLRDSEAFKLWRVAVLGLLVVGLTSIGAAQNSASDLTFQEEDGDLSEWTGDISYFSASTSKALDGSYSVRGSTDGSLRAINYYFPQAETETTTYKFDNYLVGGNSYVSLWLDNGERPTLNTGFALGDLATGEWHNITAKVYFSNDTVDWYTDGTFERTYTTSTSFSSVEGYRRASNDQSARDPTGYWEVDPSMFNQAPSIDSVSTSPQIWTLGSSIDVSANVSDSDGSVSSVSSVVADVYENGTKIVDGQALSLEASGNWTVSDLFNVDESNVYYNISVNATDDAGATATEEVSQFIKDEAPQYTVQDLENKTYYEYLQNWTLQIEEDGDNVQNENISCTVYKDGNSTGSFSGIEPYTETGSLSSDLGSHTFKASCTDPGGNTRNKTVDYTVKAFEFTSTSSQASVYETENIFYDSNSMTGSMVENITYQLFWNGSKVNSTRMEGLTGVQSRSDSLYHTIPLVYSDNSDVNWSWKADIEYKALDGGSSSKMYSSSEKVQTVEWAYYIENSDTVPSDGDYIETEDLKHDVKLHTKTKKAEITGITTYDRNGETASMEKEIVETSYTTLRGTIDVGLADGFNKSQFETSSEIKLSFNGESRTITTAKDPVNVYKIILTDGSTSLNTSKALEFDIDYEEEGYDAATRLTMDLSVWKNKDEKIRRYNFQENASETHSFYIYPSWAEYSIRTLPYPDQRQFDLIQYWNQDKNYVRRSYFFPTVQKISSSTTTVPLKTLNLSESTPIDFEITNSEGDPAVNTYCRVDRKFGGGTFETVFMIKTGSEGRSQSFAEVNEIYYGFTCYKNGQVADRFSAQIMQDPMRLQLGGGDVPTTLDYYQQFDADCTSNTTSLSCSYQSQTEKLEKATLTVERQEVMQDITVCSEQADTLTGKLSCNGLNTSANRYEYTVTGHFPGAETQGTAGFIGQQPNPIPAAGLFMTALLFMFTTAASVFDLRIGIAAGTLSFLLSSSISWIVLTPSQKATLIAVAIIAGAAVSR